MKKIGSYKSYLQIGVTYPKIQITQNLHIPWFLKG
jgi:hypothetical protein